MENALNPQVVVVQKSALDPGKRSRNSLIDLLVRAGYDRVLSGFDRKDEIAQGDFIFRGVKSPDALATAFELFRDRSLGILMGSDVLAEADVIAMQRGVRSEIVRILALGIGRCSLTFLSPEEVPLRGPDDLDDRTIFTKYPQVLASVLRELGQYASIRQCEGADTRVSEWRDRMPVAAFEIVESGDTARKNALQILNGQITLPEGKSLGLPYLELPDISTDVFISRISRMTSCERDALRTLGLALESARQTNRYISFRFNIPSARRKDFCDLGMKGPTFSPVESRDGTAWIAGEIMVPQEQKNEMRVELLRRGACDLCSGEPLNVEVSSDASEVLSSLPFVIPVSGSAESEGGVESDAAGRRELCSLLFLLEKTIAERAESGDCTSATWRALQLGTEFCSAKWSEEMQEFLVALREEKDRAQEEAADLLYRFLVALRSKGVALSSVLGLEDDAKNSSSSMDELSIRLLRAAVRFSSAVRKQPPERIAKEAQEVFTIILSALRVAGTDAKQVAECLQMRQSSSKPPKR